ncbi:hypothetical protein CSUI_005688 [Cystoisospora suis]|uniref:Uncharacterized protein n=1 Tax=Cystoisospora suis TaxID=483139 RepID=A0A2C6KX47_9APIC|nr:hypothetical protein CSUI_005688 [Cystoisospora suis]
MLSLRSQLTMPVAMERTLQKSVLTAAVAALFAQTGVSQNAGKLLRGDQVSFRAVVPLFENDVHIQLHEPLGQSIFHSSEPSQSDYVSFVEDDEEDTPLLRTEKSQSSRRRPDVFLRHQADRLRSWMKRKLVEPARTAWDRLRARSWRKPFLRDLLPRRRRGRTASTESILADKKATPSSTSAGRGPALTEASQGGLDTRRAAPPEFDRTLLSPPPKPPRLHIGRVEKPPETQMPFSPVGLPLTPPPKPPRLYLPTVEQLVPGTPISPLAPSVLPLESPRVFKDEVGRQDTQESSTEALAPSSEPSPSSGALTNEPEPDSLGTLP